MTPSSLPMLGLAAWSGTGKTTLLRKMLPMLRDHGLRVGIVKHAHHDFDIDLPGKDSYELRRAGATQVLVGSRRRWALIAETSLDEDPSLGDLLAHISAHELDLILIEGLRHEPIPKIELHRPSLGRPLLCESDPNIVAVATDSQIRLPPQVTRLDLNDAAEITRFVLDYAKLNEASRTAAGEHSP